MTARARRLFKEMCSGHKGGYADDIVDAWPSQEVATAAATAAEGNEALDYLARVCAASLREVKSPTATPATERGVSDVPGDDATAQDGGDAPAADATARSPAERREGSLSLRGNSPAAGAAAVAEDNAPDPPPPPAPPAVAVDPSEASKAFVESLVGGGQQGAGTGDGDRPSTMLRKAYANGSRARRKQKLAPKHIANPHSGRQQFSEGGIVGQEFLKDIRGRVANAVTGAVSFNLASVPTSKKVNINTVTSSFLQLLKVARCFHPSSSIFGDAAFNNLTPAYICTRSPAGSGIVMCGRMLRVVWALYPCSPTSTTRRQGRTSRRPSRGRRATAVSRSLTTTAVVATRRTQAPSPRFL